MRGVYVALGSNLGDREKLLSRALDELESLPGTCILARSSVVETEPQDCPPGSPTFLNAVVELETSLTPRELLFALQRIELELGRERGERNGPRTIDLDLILFGDAIIAEPDLIVPHPRMRSRRFVLDPLLMIAPEIRDPQTGERLDSTELHAQEH